MFSTVVMMSMLTTLVVPPVLAVLYRGRESSDAQARDPKNTVDFAVADGRLPDL
jgi:hypothetical protein